MVTEAEVGIGEMKMTKIALGLAPQSIHGAMLMLVALLVGCDSPPARFHLGMAYIHMQESIGSPLEEKDRHLQQLTNTLGGMFGTPDEPNFIDDGTSGIGQVLDLDKLRRAGGKVETDAESGLTVKGLYRQHCVHCHGITGDGAGPTAAFLNPYPRDYRMGKFKFKSTPLGVKPTDDDLTRILREGIQGTAMPSFRLLDGTEIEALVDYVKYLSIRGEVERTLVYDMIDEGELNDEPEYLVGDVLAGVVRGWRDAPTKVTPVPPPSSDRDLAESVESGRALFYGLVANCVKCHGPTALGDGQTSEYDDWANELEPKTRPDSVIAEYVALGALQPRTIRPRNLRQGVYRGGRRPVDLYWRLVNGIEGTPMPAVPLNPPDVEPDTKKLTGGQLWDLIHYVRQLPYEPLSQPRHASPSLEY